MFDEALKMEDVHLAYRDLAGAMFSKPRILGYFRRIETDPQKELFSNVNLTVKRGENIYYFGEFIPPEKLTALEVAKRKVGMVFQNGALISNLRVRDNIALPQRYHKMGTPAEIEEKVNMAMDLMRVRDEADLFPHMLSMGMQKRVAIARSWAMDPKLLLMDEPTAGLDNYNRRNLLPLIDNMRTLFKTTIIIVTHDLMISKELGCNICFLHRKTLTEPKPFDYWLNSDSEISRELFRDLRNSG